MKTAQDWMRNRIVPEQIDKYLVNGEDFISEYAIEKKLTDSAAPEPARVREIIAKAEAIESLTIDDTAVLLNVIDPELVAEMEQAAARIKKKVYDNRIVTFAPLYLSNMCVNNCLYCGLRCGNTTMERGRLGTERLRREVEVLAGRIGHKRLIVVYGEHPESDVDYMVDTIKTIYDVQVPTRNKGYGQIRRVNVNAAPLAIEDLKRLHEVGIGTYQVFQETYHRSTYARVHPSGTLKGNFRWRLYCMHRALEAGIDDVGIGSLFGLYDWKFEVMGLVSHALELERATGIGPHTVSFPRLEPADMAPFTQSPEHKVHDREFRRAITVIRLAIPYTGMILTAREDAQTRRELLPLGVTQTDASTKIGIGGYAENGDEQQSNKQQFLLGDTRNLDEVIRELASMGYITSFCTAGYRCGRTGECIMELLRTGQEGKFCKLNAVITFREWLDDFASDETKKVGEAVIEHEIEEVRVKMPKVFDSFMEQYERTKAGERDLYF
ncbi:MAG: [FeFe] hydrogenase H-cluster radical SAM maturase HydG [Chitinivibrionales bacterium]|nr:[FeFe] hydrogenase H-cluster radical SAM maturase HydG [Chitinivibrionales bacterium]MBD3357136.1 [FeFe] hydrogenase H-cluster radical SAM maturase HydG [Chitinivibrionales bacterium]